LNFFHFLEIVTGWLGAWYLPSPKIPLDENRFLQEGNRAQNTKEKIQAVLYG
jgi:hypothetical protein